MYVYYELLVLDLYYCKRKIVQKTLMMSVRLSYYLISFCLRAITSITLMYLGYKNFSNTNNSLTTTVGTNIKYKNSHKVRWSKISIFFGILTWFRYLIQSLCHMTLPITAIIQSDSACNIHSFMRYLFYHLSKSCLYCLLIARATMAYVDSPYAYSLNKTIYPLYCILFGFTIFVSICDYLFVNSRWNTEEKSCNTTRPQWGIIVTISWDLFFSIVCVILFIKPLYDIKSIGAGGNIKLTKKSEFVMQKYTTLSTVAVTSSILFLIVLSRLGKCHILQLHFLDFMNIYLQLIIIDIYSYALWLQINNCITVKI